MEEIANAIGKLVFVLWVGLVIFCTYNVLAGLLYFYFSMKKKFYDDIKENEFNAK